MASSAQEFVARIVANKEKVRRYGVALQILAGLIFLWLGWYMGHDHYRLNVAGARAQGTIVGYKTERFHTYSQTIDDVSFMPIVRYSVGDRPVEFENWLGSSTEGDTNKPVTVLYDPANPSVAMIDRGAWNWLPWAPIFALGALLALGGAWKLFLALARG